MHGTSCDVKSQDQSLTNKTVSSTHNNVRCFTISARKDAYVTLPFEPLKVNVQVYLIHSGSAPTSHHTYTHTRLHKRAHKYIHFHMRTYTHVNLRRYTYTYLLIIQSLIRSDCIIRLAIPGFFSTNASIACFFYKDHNQ